MLKKHLLLIGIFLSLAFMSIAISLYPGGSMFNKNTIGFNWSTNFISNLFGAKALNGAENPSRVWAIIGMFLIPITYAIFFNRLSKKIPDKNAATILKYGGISNVLCMFLIVTPLHDLMLNISITLFWTCIFITTIIIFKTRLHFFKVFCVLCLLVFYYSIFLWATIDWPLLPLLQKINFVDSTVLIIALDYFTKPTEFADINSRGRKEK